MKRIMKANVLPLISAAVFGIFALTCLEASAHCDGLDGPVVSAAREALANGDVNPVLIWVRQEDEAEIRRAFDQAMAVRQLGPNARELADTYFFETLVRIHRTGEGAPYTGLKPAGHDLGPAIPAADTALESGDVAPLTNLVIEQVRAGIVERYNKAVAAQAFSSEDIDAGREDIEAYVSYIHFVEGVYEAASDPAIGHYPERETPANHEE